MAKKPVNTGPSDAGRHSPTVGTQFPDDRLRLALGLLWKHGPLSRWELHERTGLTPNAAGNVACQLIDRGFVRQAPAQSSTGGRPRVPLEIDPDRLDVLGLTVTPRAIAACRMNLLGRAAPEVFHAPVQGTQHVERAIAELAGSMVTPATVCVGVSIAGLVDTNPPRVLLTSSVTGSQSLALAPLIEAVKPRPVTIVNDQHALASWWALTHRAPAGEDVLLINFGDGFLGSSILIDGRPNSGCVMAGNELGHTRLPVETQKCYCGHVGCLERICSTPFVQSRGGPRYATLDELITSRPDHPALVAMIDLLAMGIANALNFFRPRRLVLVSNWMSSKPAADYLVGQIRAGTLDALTDRIAIDIWDQPLGHPAQPAAWTALSPLYTPTKPLIWIESNTPAPVAPSPAV